MKTELESKFLAEYFGVFDELPPVKGNVLEMFISGAKTYRHEVRTDAPQGYDFRIGAQGSRRFTFRTLPGGSHAPLMQNRLTRETAVYRNFGMPTVVAVETQEDTHWFPSYRWLSPNFHSHG